MASTRSARPRTADRAFRRTSRPRPRRERTVYGCQVGRLRYALFLTCEVVGDERIRKVRAMLVRRDVLENFPYTDTMPLLENPWHEDRVKTLRAAAALYKTEPDNFLMLEVCV